MLRRRFAGPATVAAASRAAEKTGVRYGLSGGVCAARCFLDFLRFLFCFSAVFADISRRPGSCTSKATDRQARIRQPFTVAAADFVSLLPLLLSLSSARAQVLASCGAPFDSFSASA